jgi:hypothetical protein
MNPAQFVVTLLLFFSQTFFANAAEIRGWPVLEQAGCAAQESRAARPNQKLAPTSARHQLRASCATHPGCPNRGHPRRATNLPLRG